MKTIKDVLIEARGKIEKPECWTKGAFARHKNGNVIGPCEANACCWCAQGALTCVNGEIDDATQFANRVLVGFLPKGFKTTHEFNDHPDTTHADVIALFDRTIASVSS